MKEEGVSPNESTFISLSTACNHSGLVEEGVALFRSMQKDHNIRQSEKLYACFVDLLSRAGHLGEAKALVEEMPFKSSSASLEALLNGCRTHKNVNLGVKTADKLLCLGAANPGVYVVLSNIYAVARQWDKVDQVRRIMRQCGLKKTPGYSLIEIGNQLHTFLAGDSSHPKHLEIDEIVDNLKTEVEASGYVPDTSCIIRDVDESMKVKLLWGHSERLAIAFGLLSTPAGSLIQIIKNLRRRTLEGLAKDTGERRIKKASIVEKKSETSREQADNAEVHGHGVCPIRRSTIPPYFNWSKLRKRGVKQRILELILSEIVHLRWVNREL
ncbi:hypothetical protein NL676_030608 [Syzygium grande]|nr:hypothetical protein NL676_030608 [Syzygium grande]